MLAPKKVKHRKLQKGRRGGTAWRGSSLSFIPHGPLARTQGPPHDRRCKSRITSYNVCYTKLLRGDGTGGSGTQWCLRHRPRRAFTARLILRHKPVRIRASGASRGPVLFAAGQFHQLKWPFLPRLTRVITSYSIHYTKLYEYFSC